MVATLLHRAQVDAAVVFVGDLEAKDLLVELLRCGQVIDVQSRRG